MDGLRDYFVEDDETRQSSAGITRKFKYGILAGVALGLGSCAEPSLYTPSRHDNSVVRVGYLKAEGAAIRSNMAAERDRTDKLAFRLGRYVQNEIASVRSDIRLERELGQLRADALYHMIKAEVAALKSSIGQNKKENK